MNQMTGYGTAHAGITGRCPLQLERRNHMVIDAPDASEQKKLMSIPPCACMYGRDLQGRCNCPAGSITRSISCTYSRVTYVNTHVFFEIDKL
jgi:hypothetical protein